MTPLARLAGSVGGEARFSGLHRGNRGRDARGDGPPLPPPRRSAVRPGGRRCPGSRLLPRR